MKRKYILFILFISIVYLFNACKESNTSEPPNAVEVADSTYFPSNDGSYYKYDAESKNGSQETGERYTYYRGADIKGTTTYQVQIDSIILTGQASVESRSYFRKSESGVFFFLDTTGLAASTPDLIPYLQYLTIDSEMRLLFLPVTDNSSWTVFKMNINSSGLSFNPVVVTAAYDGKETLTLNLNSSNVNVETVKLKFTLTIAIPGTTTQTYTAFGWIASGIGFVKWEGNGTLIGAFTGNGIDFADTSSVHTQTLVEYNIGD